MKKITLVLGICSLLLSCGKTENSNEMARVEQKEEKLRYVAEDGTNALITFFSDKDGEKISIFSNNKTITLPQTKATESEKIYADHDIQVRSYNDSITIEQGNNIIGLKKARGQ